ncbi:MAG: Urease accessory protein UreE [Rubrivivax sp.]|nr:Urease accessory protein UreE [Rubrivivax sp.]
MVTVNKLIPQARGLAAALLKRAARVELAWDLRQKSRFDATDSAGRALEVTLPHGSVLRDGDALVAEDGSLVIVKAAPQPVLQVRACAEHGSAVDLLRAAYHLGGRRVALEFQADHLRLEPDPALAATLRAMHLVVSEERAAFEPDGGAHPRGGKPLPVTVRAAPAPHVHGPGCGHGHSHSHSDPH